jgi:hypothetical protein
MRAGVMPIALGSSCLLLLYACSGGGGSGGAVTPAIAPASSSSAPAVSSSPYPMAPGDTLVYFGQLQQTFQGFPQTVAPSEPPEPIGTTTTNVTQTVTVQSAQTFSGTSGLTDLHSAETDALSSGLKTTTSTTDTYEAIPTGASGKLLSYGSQFADEAGDTTSTLLAPAAVLDELPESTGAQWSNGPGATIDEAVAGNSTGSPITTVRTVNADGSYTEKTTFPNSYDATNYTGATLIQENSDGSGMLQFVVNGTPYTVANSVPEPQPTGPPQITISIIKSLNATATPSAHFYASDWYGTTAALYNELDQDQGTQTIPASCALNKSLPTQGTALAQTINRTDTIVGYIEKETTTSYVAPGYGPLCTVLSDTQTAYYDYSGDQPSNWTLAPPFEITTTTETLALQPSSVIAGTSSTKRTTASTTLASASGAPTFAIAPALRATFDRAVRNQRGARLARFAAALSRLRAQGATL